MGKVCAYSPEGIAQILVLDFKDFAALKFPGLYDTGIATDVLRTGEFTDIEANGASKYSYSPTPDGGFLHSLETFTNGLYGIRESGLNLATKREYVVFFKTLSGKWFCFGYDVGMSVSFVSKTDGNSGSLVTFSGSSSRPLVEVLESAITGNGYSPYFFVDIDSGFCLTGDSIGFRQAAIVFKQSRPGNLPLDINDIPISQSGAKQAIGLLSGTANPDPSRYQVQMYFNEGDTIDGVPTKKYDPVGCSVTFITITPHLIILAPDRGPGVAVLSSSNPWEMLPGPGIADITPTYGNSGTYTITFTRTAILGAYYFIFRDRITGNSVGVHVINQENYSDWVLETGAWDMAGKWYDKKIWTSI